MWSRSCREQWDARLSGESVFNICTGSGTSVLEGGRTVASLCSHDLAIRSRAEREGEIAHSYGDPTAAKRALGLGGFTELSIGLAATLAGWEGYATRGDAPKRC
jgi:UDP-glucose 4-epimerase